MNAPAVTGPASRGPEPVSATTTRRQPTINRQPATEWRSDPDDGWSIEVRRHDDAFTGLAAEWPDLHRRCATATPFQSYTWLCSWWRSYGVPGRLRLYLVRHDGRLVAAAPMMLRRYGVVAVLVPVGGALSDFTDVLVDPAYAAPATDRLVTALAADRGWQAIDVPEARPGSAALALLAAAWPGHTGHVAASLCLELPVTPMEELVRGLPAHTRKTVRRRLNQIDRLGIAITPVPAADATRAVSDLLALHARQWQGRGGNPEHQRRRFADHLSGAVGPMIESGEAAVLEYRVDDRLMASSLVITAPSLAGGYLYGADPGLRDRVDVLTLLLSSTLELAHRHGCSTLSMLRGAEPYKLRWRPREQENRRLLLARPGSLRGRAFVAAVRAERLAIRSARDRLPWLRTLRDRVRARSDRVRALPDQARYAAGRLRRSRREP